jgi:hypothetical protein
MWIMTTAGMYSAVQKGEDPAVLTVRTRTRDAAQTAADALEMEFGESVEITVGQGTDYPYRFEVSRENFAHWVAYEIRNFLDYDNFKNAAAACNGAESGYVNGLSKTWAAMLDATDEEGQNYGALAPNPHYSGGWKRF